MKKILASILILILSNVGLVYAANEPSTYIDLEIALKPVIQKNVEDLVANPTNCKIILPRIYDDYTKLFFKFLEENFNNKSSNTSLTNIAIAKFREYKTLIEDTFLLVTPDIGGEGLAQQFTTISECAQLTQTYIEVKKELMIDHIRNTSAQKRATIFVEKSRVINNRLSDLNLQIAYMFSHFASFNNRLPQFVKNCVQ